MFLPVALEEQGSTTYTPVQVINLEIKDNHEEATLGAFLILQLCEMVSIIPHTVKLEKMFHFGSPFKVVSINHYRKLLYKHRPY